MVNFTYWRKIIIELLSRIDFFSSIIRTRKNDSVNSKYSFWPCLRRSIYHADAGKWYRNKWIGSEICNVYRGFREIDFESRQVLRRPKVHHGFSGESSSPRDTGTYAVVCYTHSISIRLRARLETSTSVTKNPLVLKNDRIDPTPCHKTAVGLREGTYKGRDGAVASYG